MGWFDFLTGSKAAAKGVARVPQAELRSALLALNRDTAPWIIRDGAPEGCDLVAEWRIADARWFETFARASLVKVSQTQLKFDEQAGEVRSVDRDWTIEWRVGVPFLSLSVDVFRGQKTEISFGTAYAFTETARYGQVYNYRFNSKEMKGPLQDAASLCGWGWRGVAFGKL
jgi:hypothetical protein